MNENMEKLKIAQLIQFKLTELGYDSSISYIKDDIFESCLSYCNVDHDIVTIDYLLMETDELYDLLENLKGE